MCTAIALQSAQGELFLGRNMDFSYPLEPQLFFSPQGYRWRNALGSHAFLNRYSYLGVGQQLPNVVVADGVNERGLAVAALYFPGYASYSAPVSAGGARPLVGSTELTGFLLGTCATVEQAAAALRGITLVGVADPITQSVAPLHWLVSDRSGRSMTVEPTADGLHLLHNPLGLLANSPDLGWQMTNLRGYLQLTPEQFEQAQWQGVRLKPFGQAGGTVGLPGDFTSPSRFVRAAYLKSHLPTPQGREAAVVAGFRLLQAVAIPRGAVMTGRGTDDYTQYTGIMNTATGEYFFTTYQNPQITVAHFPDDSLAPGQTPVALGRLERPPCFTEL